MTKNDTLLTEIKSLVARRTEGTYWDFKRCHHTDKGDLIHDILCLANAEHRGSRFLIFGVNNSDFSLHAISDDTGRKTQADIAGLFRDNASKFFQSRFPDFYLTEMVISGTLLYVLIIEDTPHKPYYLVERYEKVCAHHIYTRVCDTNTPTTDAAQPHEIERMWRERFGLDLSPLGKMQLYLGEVDSWVPSNRIDQNLFVHHKIFPEFTLGVTEAEDVMARNEEWTRGQVCTDNNHAGYYEIRYHQTCLARVRYVSFDNRKKSMVAPTWKPLNRGAGRFYYYEADSIDYTLQKWHATSGSSEDHSTTLSIRGNGESSVKARSRWGSGFLKIPVVSKEELDGFLGHGHDLPPTSGPRILRTRPHTFARFMQCEQGLAAREPHIAGAQTALAGGGRHGLRQTLTAFGRPRTNAVGTRCTTRLLNTHNTRMRRVLYDYHPWTGRNVHVEKIVEKVGVCFARCRLIGDGASLPLEVPLWMFDRQACSSVRFSECPLVDLSGLSALQFLLAEIVNADGHDLPLSSSDPDLSADLKSCDQNQGDDHAPISNETRSTGPVRPDGKNVSMANAAMAEPAAAGTPQDHRANGTAADGIRHKPRARTGGRNPQSTSERGER